VNGRRKRRKKSATIHLNGLSLNLPGFDGAVIRFTATPPMMI
jgi:hypothetical protein